MSQRHLSLTLAVFALLIALPVSAQLIELPAFESVKVGSLHIEFDELLFEERCPADVFCIWEGDAAIRVVVTRRDAEEHAFELHTFPGSGSVAEGDGYTIRLLQLQPYPLLEKKPLPEEYVATLLLSVTAPSETMSWSAVKGRF